MTKVLQPIQQLHQFFGCPVIPKWREVSIVQQLIAMISLMLAKFGPGTEALQTKVYRGNTLDTYDSEEGATKVIVEKQEFYRLYNYFE